MHTRIDTSTTMDCHNCCMTSCTVSTFQTECMQYRVQ